MTWRALAELRPSFEATKHLLLPFTLRRWLVLAVIAFFVSGASGANPNFSMAGGGTSGEPSPAMEFPLPISGLSSPSDAELVVIFLVLGLVVGIGLVLLLLGAIMEFVFVRMATDREIRIRGYFSDNIPKGLSLFLFRLGIAFVLIALVVLPAIVVFLLSPLLLVLAVLLVPILLSVGVGAWVVLRLTADFVVPVMLLEGVGVITAWRRFQPTLITERRQYGIYIAVRLLLGLGAGTLAGIGFIAIGLAFLLPFGIAAGAVYLVFGVIVGATWITIGTLVVLAASYGLSILVAGVTCIQVPIQTYLRYYSLFVLGSITPRFDMVESLRSENGGHIDDRALGSV